jgi:hypothetical protein
MEVIEELKVREERLRAGQEKQAQREREKEREWLEEREQESKRFKEVRDKYRDKVEKME